MQPALPEHLSPAVRAALTDAAALGTLYGDRLRRLVLFGSQARGDAHAESDVDVLVVLDGEVDYMAEVRRMLDFRMTLLNEYELLVSFIPVTLATYRNDGHPLMMNVRQEGAVLARATCKQCTGKPTKPSRRHAITWKAIPLVPPSTGRTMPPSMQPVPPC